MINFGATRPRSAFASESGGVRVRVVESTEGARMSPINSYPQFMLKFVKPLDPYVVVSLAFVC
jgi:hypothetical protein